MCAPPAAAAQEAPVEELPGARGEAVELPSGDVDRDDVWAFSTDLGDAEAVAPREHDGLPQAEHENQHHDRYVEPYPVHLGDRVTDEVGADDELVHKCKRNRQVCIQVDAVPGLVRE